MEIEQECHGVYRAEIVELLDERLGSFQVEIAVGQLGAQTPSFRERALLVPQYAADKEIKKTRYHDMLQYDIQNLLAFQLVELWRT